MSDVSDVSEVRDDTPADDAGRAQPAPADAPSPAAPAVTAEPAAPAEPAAAAPVYPPTPPPPPGYQQLWGAPAAPAVPAAPPKPRSRVGRYASLAVAGFLVIAAASAGVTVAVGSPGGSSQAAAPARPTAPLSPAPGRTPTPTAAPSSSAPIVVPTVAPAPATTVKGTVSGDSHSGDLRFFLLPLPSGAQPINDVDGTKESLSVLSKEMADPSQGLADLRSWNCVGGATREYRSSDGTLTVRTELLHFGDSADADGWYSGLRFGSGTSFSVPGLDDAKGWAFDPSDSEGFGSITGVSHVGDVMFQIDIDGTGKIDHSLLTPLMKREAQLLRTGH
ncbi:hypothetical protein GXW83_00470 [Streptacidiphilus sp. PB12-B1b]|uniref:hypothetical protein n=1 Tax=Streptacidiphilus sp. PB12-B1b TaxID=2705012 RepID=UPI0015FC36C8|nr:hypothetical protein [Streptacidiphilus sp. PB12-B1b]QMU74489.1 hypothetical protein GXW83_00470 [Streptacidiphilus sp. PB12-B1b]